MKHGISRYKNGYCRCDVCQAANTEAQRSYVARKLRERRGVDTELSNAVDIAIGLTNNLKLKNTLRRAVDVLREIEIASTPATPKVSKEQFDQVLKKFIQSKPIPRAQK